MNVCCTYIKSSNHTCTNVLVRMLTKSFIYEFEYMYIILFFKRLSVDVNEYEKNKISISYNLFSMSTKLGFKLNTFDLSYRHYI